MRRAAIILVLLGMLACEPGRPTPIPSCTAEQISFTPMVEGAGGATVAYIEIRHSGASCRLRVEVGLRIVGEAGKTVEITSNPSSVSVDRIMPSDIAGVTWSWHNWCGDPISIRYVFSVEEKERTLGSKAGPRCDSPGGESFLQLVS